MHDSGGGQVPPPAGPAIAQKTRALSASSQVLYLPNGVTVTSGMTGMHATAMRGTSLKNQEYLGLLMIFV
jgi:hypothetical protein